MFAVRWMYKRRIRKKSEILRVKYKKEDELRRETEYRLKEIALRPIQTHFYQPCGGDHSHGNLPEAQRQVQSSSEQYRPESLQGRVSTSDNREISSSNQLQPSPGDGLVKQGLFTGLTPLSSTQQQLVRRQQEVEGSTTGLTGTGDTGKTSSTVSTTTIGTTPTASTTVVQMDPTDVATTVHTIAKNYRGKDDRPPAPGVLLASRRTKSSDSVTSDRITTPRTTTSGSVVTPATSGTSRTSSTRPSTTRTTTGTTPISSEVAVSPLDQPVGKRERKHVKRRKSAPIPGGAVRVIEMNKQMMTGPPSRSYFPYWTAQRSVSTSVEPVGIFN
ncbi:hypothetical protein ANCCAN_02332 [Ancylostoma caninum]|uniref:Uncharacterized protein n=1 Tax=Ancylostoma caninum TaxID=29170 RepID=A0A368H521_ANCCA|nr:hypothetical protein ANCCAN_02332 [Ancylostoma caninum]